MGFVPFIPVFVLVSLLVGAGILQRRGGLR